MSTQLVEPDNSFSQLTSADYLGTSPNYGSYSQYLSYGDDDYSYLYAYAGETISISTSGGYYLDTTLSLYQGYGGSLVAYDDDGGYGYNSSLNYYVQTSGYYYVDVAGYQDNYAGSYTLNVNVA